MAVEQTRTGSVGSVELPAPTAWPIVAAFGVALLFAGFGHDRFGQHSGRDINGLRLGGLVPRCASAREA